MKSFSLKHLQDTCRMVDVSRSLCIITSNLAIKLLNINQTGSMCLTISMVILCLHADIGVNNILFHVHCEINNFILGPAKAKKKRFFDLFLKLEGMNPPPPLVSRSQTHPTASEGKGLGTSHTTTCSSTTGCLASWNTALPW